MKLSCNILKVEKFINFLVWVLAVIYSIYCFTTKTYTYFLNDKDEYGDFTRGLPFLSTKRDKTDFEWETIYYLLYNFYPWILIYIVISEIIHTVPLAIELVETFGSWSLHGYGYVMGQFFHIKYVVLYGLSSSFASFENVKVSHLPRCIGRIHLYSDMWKYFDPGLYQFLVRYIYIPMMKVSRYKLIASLFCFLFVYLWHGIQKYILVWTVLNYIGITLEYICNLCNKKYIETRNLKKILGPSWLRRIKCILASPLLVMSAISNFYFFAGIEIGNIFSP
ncbi:hypothetical protein NQ314_013348 [Rhamnusium bicolor]|uniref:Protein-cysteine N-palmitoyltransferase Rasp n=1 Tax=Rhamnusium bicolor TaxID=1586634 RepID=A0AAV8X7E4_9CUCU|nr:hypothetical protein NQ314_013348 [Rhamnusium bicolor]